MSTIRLAILDEQLTAQIAATTHPFQDVAVVWTGTDPALYRDQAPALRPDVLVVDLSHLGNDPAKEAR